MGAQIVPPASRDEKVRRAVGLLGMGLGVALLDAGWELDNGIGRPLVLVHRGGATECISPFEVVHSLCDGTLGPEAWRVRCQELGIAGIQLGARATAPGFATT